MCPIKGRERGSTILTTGIKVGEKWDCKRLLIRKEKKKWSPVVRTQTWSSCLLLRREGVGARVERFSHVDGGECGIFFSTPEPACQFLGNTKPSLSWRAPSFAGIFLPNLFSIRTQRREGVKNQGARKKAAAPLNRALCPCGGRPWWSVFLGNESPSHCLLAPPL